MFPFYQGCRLFQSLRFRNVLQEVQRRFCADSKSEWSNPKLPSGRAYQCPEVSNCSRLHLFGRLSNVSRRSSVFDKKLDFLLRHRYGKTVAFVWTTGQHCPNAILDKAISGEELQPSGRLGNTVRSPVFIIKITCSKSAIVQTLGQHCPDAALIWYYVKRVMESQLHSFGSDRLSLCDAA
jgi:hypothetical protein